MRDDFHFAYFPHSSRSNLIKDIYHVHIHPSIETHLTNRKAHLHHVEFIRLSSQASLSSHLGYCGRDIEGRSPQIYHPLALIEDCEGVRGEGDATGVDDCRLSAHGLESDIKETCSFSLPESINLAQCEPRTASAFCAQS